VARVEDWPTVLAEEIIKAKSRPFVWGTHDCCLWACNVVLAMTGKDIAEWFRGRYHTRRQAYGALRKFAGGGIYETVRRRCDELGFPQIAPVIAQRGDLILFRSPLGDALGICVGSTVAAVGQDGLVFESIRAARKAWRI
jgi:hypothetical protein